MGRRGSWTCGGGLLCGIPFITFGGMKIEAAITTSLALFNLQLGRCDQPSQGPPRALQHWQWRQRAPQRQSACAVLTGVPIHITPLASMIQWPPQWPLLLTARCAVPVSITRRPLETADRLHSPLKVELEDLIKAKKVPAPPQPLPRSFICSRGLPPTCG